MLITYNSPRQIHELPPRWTSSTTSRTRTHGDVPRRLEGVLPDRARARSCRSTPTRAWARSTRCRRRRVAEPDDPTPGHARGPHRHARTSAAARTARGSASEFTRVFAARRSPATRPPTTTTAMVVDVNTTSFEAGGAHRLRSHRPRYDKLLVRGRRVVSSTSSRLDPMMVQMGSRLDNQLNPRAVLRLAARLSTAVEHAASTPASCTSIRLFEDPYNPTTIRKRRAVPDLRRARRVHRRLGPRAARTCAARSRQTCSSRRTRSPRASTSRSRCRSSSSTRMRASAHRRSSASAPSASIARS